MQWIRTHARLLYCLALFQLVGGPAVLCGIALLAKTVAHSSGQKETSEGISAANSANDWEAAWNLILGTPPGGDPLLPSSPGGKDKKLDVGKAKIAFGIVNPNLDLAWRDVHNPPPIEKVTVFVPTWPNAPPGPPPKCV